MALSLAASSHLYLWLRQWFLFIVSYSQYFIFDFFVICPLASYMKKLHAVKFPV